MVWQPEFWPTGLGGYAADGTWQQGFEAYAAYFHRVALQLNPCADGRPLLSGPGWGNVNTQDPKWLAEIATRGKGCYLKEVLQLLGMPVGGRQLSGAFGDQFITPVTCAGECTLLPVHIERHCDGQRAVEPVAAGGAYVRMQAVRMRPCGGLAANSDDA